LFFAWVSHNLITFFLFLNLLFDIIIKGLQKNCFYENC
jgi:hypothetical protein